MSLALAVIHARAVYGMDWYHRPGFWPTRDGVIPWAWFWHEVRALPAVQAMQRMQLAHGISVAQADQTRAGPVLERWRRELHGGD